jgi:hypothetical protein
MRRVGLVLLAIGLAGFLLASAQRARYDTAEGSVGTAAPALDRKTRDAWETARWLLAGTAVMGIVFTALPGKRES